ncbi:MAG: sugar phosphate isomerase/epimerase family protein [Gemmatales bacterium]|nr:sugar phosphate isomerase/epimerase [Gemmatales bacterium]MCS7159653.1 sugar phosphate isomerase/epimerase [Gemmatales bacterium]MDW8174851.1 sugar phosphate isomerase/epimerase family protein [Gemmatales bacterium]MDW8223354.1 sugar phosphate isomerase/epimerase family protein [Gemmatales bacterium]
MAEAHFTLSAFADEISPDLNQQLTVLEQCGIRHLELRSVWQTNVLDLTDEQVREVKRQLDARGFRLSAIGSPIGKVKITDPFEPHLQRFRRAVELCQVFGTPNIRIFSYYPPAPNGGSGQGATDWSPFRNEILERMRRKLEIAERAGVRLLHENEHRIYGDSPERVLDLLTTLNHPQFRAVYDPANYVFCGYDPWQGWIKTRDWTVHFHIKDWIRGELHARPAGEGHGRIPEVLADAVQRGYRGFATLEPHLLGGGPTGGVTGPELFPKAVAALRAILDGIGARYD